MSVDVLAAVRTFLLADTDVSALTTKIYVGEFPDTEVENMPQALVVIRGSGGNNNNDYVEIVQPRIDVYNYGTSYANAGSLDLAVYSALKHLMRETVGGVLLHGVACGGGPIQVKHVDTGWPIMWRSYTVTAADIEIED
jgi:hypothetical protein